MEADKKPLKVVIIGGSLSGLMVGIALKHAGHAVTIIEREDNVRQSHMAGVCLGLDADRYLARHDRIADVFSHRCVRIQAFRKDHSIRVFLNARRDLTSWDTFYFRLRANFDGFASSFYPKPPLSSPTDGPVLYDGEKQVLDMRRDHENDKMVLTVLNRNTNTTVTAKADLVIGADGPDSFVRAKYLPTCKREYVGYIAWRGTVPESEVSEETRQIFHSNVTAHLMSGNHCIMYMIPGINGSLEPGERFLNFLWYTNETPESLDEIMIDGVDGHRHHNIVPAGRVRKDIWEARLEEAKRIPLPAPLLEVVLKIKQPFIQVITEFVTPQAAFEDGKVLLTGDSLCLYRPHTAFSGTQAAFLASSIEEYVAGKRSLADWEERALRYAGLHLSQSVWFGKFYQCTPLNAIGSAFYYWWYCAYDRVKSWWRGEEPLMRGVTYVLENEM